MKTAISPRIFISYSHQVNGPKWKDALLHALQVFEQYHLLDVWQDGKIRLGSHWDDDIIHAMTSARMAVVLLTPEALKSRYILEKEFPILRDRQQLEKLTIFPVVCEPCDWRVYDWLQATQAPNDSHPLSELSEAGIDQVFRQLATQIAEELSRGALAELSPSLRGERAGIRSGTEIKAYLDKFPLPRSSGLREEKLIGRAQELALLDLAFAQPHTAIVSLVAWGGVGKTMLVQHWLQHLQHKAWFGVQRVYAWSFYSQGTKEDKQASEDTFLAHALEWFGVKCEPTLSPWDKGRLLADAVVRERTLLILDGIEPLQYPPGPMGGQLRAPGVQSLLKQIARKANSIEHRGLCIVTTREPLTDLADFERRPDTAWGSVLRLDLSNLTEDAGAMLLHHAGANRAGAAEIKADDVEFLAASREVDGHALTLKLLGRFLHRAHGGDIRRRDLVKFEEADRKEQGGTTFKMLAAFENWFARSGEFGARQLAVLRMLGLFDRPPDADCIAALRRPPAIAGLTDPLFTMRLHIDDSQTDVQPLPDEDWNTATSFLADFGLVVVQTDNKNRERLLDCHPLIRQYFANQAHERYPETWRIAHQRLHEHLRKSTEYQPDTLEGLQPLYQAIVHACHAGLHRIAVNEIYWTRILRGFEHYSWKKLGSISEDLSAISYFYEFPWGRLTTALSAEEDGLLLHQSALYLRALGRLTEAVEPLDVVLNHDVRASAWNDAAMSANLLSELKMLLGELSDALRYAEMAVDFADRNDWSFYWIANRTAVADVLHQMGRHDEALVKFQKAEALLAQYQPEQPILYSLGGLRYCDALLSKLERLAWHLLLLRSMWLMPLPELHRNLPSAGEIPLSGGETTALFIKQCQQIEKSAMLTLQWSEEAEIDTFSASFDQLTLGLASLLRVILDESAYRSPEAALEPADKWLHLAMNGLRRSNFQEYVVRVLLALTWFRCLKGDTIGARTGLDEAWDIAERGPMRLHLADIHLYRARLFFRVKPYPWQSPQADLAAAEKLIHECGYHRRDEELADAKQVILSG